MHGRDQDTLCEAHVWAMAAAFSSHLCVCSDTQRRVGPHSRGYALNRLGMQHLQGMLQKHCIVWLLPVCKSSLPIAVQVTLPRTEKSVNPYARSAHKERGQDARAIVGDLMQQRGWKSEGSKIAPVLTLPASLARLGKPRKGQTAMPTDADILKSIA
jgi:hypothetical protein